MYYRDLHVTIFFTQKNVRVRDDAAGWGDHGHHFPHGTEQYPLFNIL